MIIVTYNIIRINNRSLDVAEKLNQKLKNNNFELESANEELVAAIEELEATNEEFEAQNEDLRQSQEELRSSREELLAVFNSSHDGFIIFDETGKIRETSVRAREMFSMTADRMINMNINDFSCGEGGAPPLDEIPDSVFNGKTFVFEWKARRPEDNTPFDLEVGLSLIRRNEESLVLSSLRDITSRKQIETAVKESERKYRLITENATDVIFTMDRDFNFTYISPSVEKVFGYNVEEAIELSMQDFFAPESLSIATKALVRTKSNFDEIDPQRVIYSEFEMYRKDGSIIWTEHKYTFLKDENEDTIGITGVVSDITERKKAEQDKERFQNQLMQVQRMEAVGTLAGGVAHDFNNILGGIMGSLNLLDLFLDSDGSLNRGEMKSYIETALNATKRAADITKQLLTLSSRSEPQRFMIDIIISLRNISDICRNSFPKSVEIVVDIPDENIYVNGDPSQIEQMFLNLCLNASHAMTIMRPEGDKEGGILKISVEKIICDRALKIKLPEAEEGRSYVKVEVSDTGVGIDEDIEKHIFDPFYTTKKDSGGTGLGLAMVYAIAAQHSGIIDLLSEPGYGSVFTVYLPEVKEVSETLSGSSSREELVQGDGTVLIVDDEKGMRKVTGGILKKCGYGVITASNGRSALKIFEKEHSNIGAVLLDLSMPGMSGIEVLGRMKEIDPEVKVVLVSGFIEDESIKLASDKGVAGILRKPFSAVDLSFTVKNLFK